MIGEAVAPAEIRRRMLGLGFAIAALVMQIGRAHV